MIDKVYYINLEHREDRKSQMLFWIEQSGFELSKVERIPAIYNHEKGHVGCLLSHIKALDTFIKSDNKICIIFEDDYVPLNVNTFWNNVNKLENIDFDLVMVCYNEYELQIKETKYDFLKKCLHSYTASGYILNKNFAYKLKELFEECVKLAINETFTSHHFCLDTYWMKLMRETEKWYCFYPRLGVQRESYSDILKKVVDYKC